MAGTYLDVQYTELATGTYVHCICVFGLLQEVCNGAKELGIINRLRI